MQSIHKNRGDYEYFSIFPFASQALPTKLVSVALRTVFDPMPAFIHSFTYKNPCGIRDGIHALASLLAHAGACDDESCHSAFWRLSDRAHADREQTPIKKEPLGKRRSVLFCNSVCKPGSVLNGHLSSLGVTTELRVAPCHLRTCVGPTSDCGVASDRVYSKPMLP